MSEQILAERLIKLNWRVVLGVGTMGVHNTIDPMRVESIPLLAATGDDNILVGKEDVKVVPVTDSDAYLIDWRLGHKDPYDALAHAVHSTNTLKDSIDLGGVEIRTAKMAVVNGLYIHNPMIIWEDMPDYTSRLARLDQLKPLPDNLSVEDFML